MIAGAASRSHASARGNQVLLHGQAEGPQLASAAHLPSPGILTGIASLVCYLQRVFAAAAVYLFRRKVLR